MRCLIQLLLVIGVCINGSSLISCLLLRDPDGFVFDVETHQSFNSRFTIKFNIICLVLEILILFIFYRNNPCILYI